nr:MAG TPA: hypothetical protein [Bacteriophage sp.]
MPLLKAQCIFLTYYSYRDNLFHIFIFHTVLLEGFTLVLFFYKGVNLLCNRHGYITFSNTLSNCLLYLVFIFTYPCLL